MSYGTIAGVAALLDMRPTNALDNLADVVPIDVKASGKFMKAYAFGMQSTDNAHIMLSQLRKTIPFAARGIFRAAINCLSTLGYFVVHVVLLCSEEQMIRPNTLRVITVVKYLQAIRDQAVVHLPRHTVCALRSSLVANRTVPKTPAKCRSPYPARTTLFDSSPKPLIKGVCGNCVLTIEGVGTEGMLAKAAQFSGRIAHVGSSFIAIGHASGCLQQRGGFVLP